jgi:HEAT repeat protein
MNARKTNFLICLSILTFFLLFDSGNTINVLSAGSPVIKVVENAAGNRISTQPTFIVAAAAPIVNIIAPAPNTNSSTPYLIYKASRGTVTVKVDGAVVNKVSDNTLDVLSAGRHTVSVQVTDADGRTTSAQVTFTVRDSSTDTDSTVANSELYKYQASDGNIYITDDSSKIPESQIKRSQVKIKNDVEMNSRTDAANQKEQANYSNNNNVEQYMRDLNSADINTRAKAALELGRLHSIEGVRTALKDSESKVRYAAISNLSTRTPESGSMKRDLAAEALIIQSLKDNAREVRYTALNHLREYKTDYMFKHADIDPSICKPIAELLHDSDYDIRWHATDILEGCSLENIDMEFLKIANDNNENINIRTKAIYNLARSKLTIVDRHLLHFLDDPKYNRSIKMFAIQSLGIRKNRNAVEKIIPYVNSGDQSDHFTVVHALGNIGDPAAVDALASILIDKSGKVDTFVLESLRNIGSPKAVPYILKIKPALRGSDEKIKFAEVLGVLGSEEAVPTLLDLIKEKDPNIQLSASRALQNFDSPSALQKIVEAAKKEPANTTLASLAQKAKHNLDFPAEALKEKTKREEEKYVMEREVDINNIYHKGVKLFREKQYEQALPLLYDAVDKFEKLYSEHPTHFNSSMNAIRPIRGLLASYYRWKIKDAQKSVKEYRKLIAVLNKYDTDPRASANYYFKLGEVYEKDVRDFETAIDCYKSVINALTIANPGRDDGMIFVKWYLDWLNFQIERINVVQLNRQKSFSPKKLRYPNVEYKYFTSFGGMWMVGQLDYIDDDFSFETNERQNIETIDKLNAKYPGSYTMLSIGTNMFYKFVKEAQLENAKAIVDKLRKLYPNDINIIMIMFDLADEYKKQNDNRQYNEATNEGLNIAKNLNINVQFGADQRFSSPEKTWQLMLESLKKNDLQTACEFFSFESARRYKEIFTALGREKVRQMAVEMRQIQKIIQDADTAKYRIRRNEQGQEITYYIYFVNIFGDWKIQQF